MNKLKAFAKQEQPGGWDWCSIENRIRMEDPAFKLNSPLASGGFLHWAVATIAIYCTLFGTGKLIVGDTFAENPVIPGRLLGSLLIGAGILAGI